MVGIPAEMYVVYMRYRGDRLENWRFVCMDNEIWKSVVGAEDYYEISNLGRCKRIKSAPGCKVGRILKPCRATNGYYQYELGLGSRVNRMRVLIHKLVMDAFVGPCPEGKEIHHKDLDPSNNVLDNLEYLTPSVNIQHAVLNGAGYVGESNGKTHFVKMRMC